jgi:anti-sigma regulatory factor (Ser/Thr protein kinase)
VTGDHGQHWPIDEDLSALRERLQYHAVRAGVRGERLDDLLLVTNEAVINILEHGGGKGTLSIWQNETYLTVDVTDTLGVLTSWHVPRERPTGTVRGFGLWLMNQLCDEFAIEQTEEGSRVRLRMRLGLPSTQRGTGGSTGSTRDIPAPGGAPGPLPGVPNPAGDDPGQDELQVSF